jgi:glutathione reductase (NADPH)
MPSLLPRMDSDAVSALKQESERIGIEILTDVTIGSIEKTSDGLTVHFEHEGTKKSSSAACVANGTGRIANVDGLDLDAGQIDHDGLRISVDEYLCSTSNRDVYVAGDALWSSAQLSPVATYEGRIAARNILNGNNSIPEYASIPSAVYTVPALASVGMSEAEALTSGLDVQVRINDLRDWRSSKMYAETAAYSKVILQAGSGKILGAHVLGHGGEEIIHLFAFAMKHGLTTDDLKDTVYGYPTFASDLKYML